MARSNSLQTDHSLATPQTSTGLHDRAPFDLAVLHLDDTGVIRDCSRACRQLFGYLPDELMGCHVSVLLPDLPAGGLVQEERINARLAYLCHCGIAFPARHRDGRHFSSELFINRLDHHNVVVLVRCLDVSKANGANRPFH